MGGKVANKHTIVVVEKNPQCPMIQLRLFDIEMTPITTMARSDRVIAILLKSSEKKRDVLMSAEVIVVVSLTHALTLTHAVTHVTFSF